MGENLRFFFGEIIGALLATGAVLTACMAILWAGQIWRGTKPDEQRAYLGATRSAAKMVFAFFAAMFGAVKWMGEPIYLMILALPGG